MESPHAPTIIGPYRIVRELARGPMGVVYLAHDIRPALDRTVVLKTLPPDVAVDPMRLERFKRESKLLALVHHPNVCAIYDVLEGEGARYLALEHIEGESLAQRLARGALPIPQALDICLQIATGMEAAHERGVIHRDLKPANVMITPGGQVKVVDFGLAKGAEDLDPVGVDSSAVSPSAPTITSQRDPPATMTGMIPGTLPYLSPEQIEGKVADRRTDIWAFGCVLYECLTGRRAFAGGSQRDTIAAILERDPDWSRVPGTTPRRVEELLRRCLEKDPRSRVRDIGEARIALGLARTGKDILPAVPARSATRLSLAAIAGGVALSAVLGAGAWILGAGHATDHADSTARLSITIPPEIRIHADGLHLGMTTCISPDGRTLVFGGKSQGEGEGRGHLYRRRLDGFQPEPIEGSEGAWAARFTRDGKWLTFSAYISDRTSQLRLMKVPVEGNAAPVTLTVLDPSWTDWVVLESGDVLANDIDRTHYVRIPGKGGAPSSPIPLRPPGYQGTLQLWRALPGDRGVLLNTLSYGGGDWQAGIGVLDLRSGRTKILVRDGSSPRYVATGHLLFSRGDVLLAAPFDLARLEIKGEPITVTNGIRCPEGWVNAPFDVSDDGTLVYAPGGIAGFQRRLVVVDPRGQVADWSGEEQHFCYSPDVTSDGTRVAVTVENARHLNEVWVSARGQPARRLIADPNADCGLPIWSRDGREIAYSRTSSDGKSGIYVQALERGTATRIYDTKARNASEGATSWSPDGSAVLIRTLQAGNADIVCVPLPAGKPATGQRPILASTDNEFMAQLSPDGNLIAFNSDESGSIGEYVAAYGPQGIVGEPITLASEGDLQIRWNREGNRIYYASKDGHVMSVGITTKPTLRASKPTPCWDLAQLKLDDLSWGILPDGSLLAIRKDENEDDLTRFDVVLNLARDLERHPRAERK